MIVSDAIVSNPPSLHYTIQALHQDKFNDLSGSQSLWLLNLSGSYVMAVREIQTLKDNPGRIFGEELLPQAAAGHATCDCSGHSHPPPLDERSFIALLISEHVPEAHSLEASQTWIEPKLK